MPNTHITNGPASWSTNVASGDLVELNEIAGFVNDTLSSVAANFIEIGHRLNRARLLIDGDKEFGQWREQHTELKSRQMAHACMSAARKFAGNAIVGKVAFTVIRELTSASDDVVARVEKRVEDGETVTRREVEQMKRDEKADKPLSTPSRRSESKKEPPEATPEPPAPTPTQEAREAVDYQMLALPPEVIDTVMDALRHYRSVEPDAVAFAEAAIEEQMEEADEF